MKERDENHLDPVEGRGSTEPRKRIAVLLIEDDPDYVTLVQMWLAASKDYDFEVSWTDTVQDGIARLAGGGIDVILLDLSLPDSSGSETFLSVFASAEETPIVLLSGDDSDELAVELVSLGAQDYLVKGASSGGPLIRSILYAMSRRPAGDATTDSSRAQVVGVMGATGGVGVTSFACTLAAELREQADQSVLLCDFGLNAQGATFRFGLNPKRTLYDALEHISQLDAALLGSIVTEGPGGVDFLASPGLAGRPAPEADQLVALVRRLTRHYEWLVLDLGRIDATAMAVAPLLDTPLVAATSALPSLREARQLRAAFDGHDIPPSGLRLAVTQMAHHPKIPPSSLEQATGIETAVFLPHSQDLLTAEENDELPKAGSAYRGQVAAFARSLAGLPEEKPPARRLTQILNWR